MFGLNEQRPFKHTTLTTEAQVDYNKFAFITVVRPYAVQLLANLYKEGKFDLAVFSMGVASYVQACAELLQNLVRQYLQDETVMLFKQIKSRGDSKYNAKSDLQYKDLSVFNDYQNENILLVDNLASNFLVNTRQGIPIQSYSLEYIVQRECSNKNIRCDIALLRLYIYLSLLDAKLPLQKQNVFGVYT